MRTLYFLICSLLAAAALAGCAKTKSTATTAPSGANVYAADCASCHQINGEGSPGAFPPLAGNPVVTGDPVKVIHIVKYGLTGPLQVNGKQYSGMMPAWGSQISDAEIAAAITYIRGSWGNHAAAVTADAVAGVAK